MNRLVGALLVAAACFEYRVVIAPQAAREDLPSAQEVMCRHGQHEWRVVTAIHEDRGFGDGWWRIVFERPIPCPTATPTAKVPKP